MPKQKYNWTALHKEFLKSPIDEVKVFIETKYGQWKWNWTFNRNTRWWSKEKQEMKNKAMVDATENALKKMTKDLEIPMEQLTIAKTNAVIKVINKMQAMDKVENTDLNDLDKIIKILRTEMGLPITYSKNENTNIDKIEWIHIILWWAPTNEK